MSKGYMYILQCSDNSYYTGSTKDLERRLQQHQNGEGANHTKKRLPVKLVYYEEFERIDKAFQREKQVQGWSRAKKEVLIQKMPEKLHELAKCLNESSHVGFGSAQPTTTKKKRCLSEVEGRATYDSYKDSGVEWIGEIPSSWSKSKNRYGFVKHKNGKNESNDTPVLSLTTKGVKIKTNLNFGKSTESYIGHQLVEKGDIVFTPRDFDQTPILSDVSKFYGCISNLYIVDKTNERVLNHFVNYYWYGLKYSVDYFKNFSHGMRFSFNRFQFDEIPLLVPPLSEQQQIVSFLDTKTSLIDSLIEKTGRKIELLKEKRTTLINEVVTGKKRCLSEVEGRATYDSYKDSGVEWIGEIPSGWKTSKLGFYTTKIGSGSTPRGGSEVYVDSGIPFIRSQNVHFDGLKLENISHIEHEIHKSMKGSTVIKNDVLLNITGGSIGRCCIVNVEGEMNTNQHVSIIRTTNNLLSVFLNYILNSDVGQSQVIYNISGGNREGLTIEGIRNFRITLPPISEQQQIVSYLDEQTQKTDNTISIEEKRIELLKEYRQSLISEVVTGKRKVI